MRRDCPRRQRSHGTEAEHVDHLDMQGTFYTCICFLFIMFINASCVIGLGLEVEAFREAKCRRSSLGCGVRVDLIGQDYE